MSETYRAGWITVVLVDGRRLEYPETQPPAEVIADLHARGVGPGSIRSTVHVIPRGRIDRPLVIALDHTGDKG